MERSALREQITNLRKAVGRARSEADEARAALAREIVKGNRAGQKAEDARSGVQRAELAGATATAALHQAEAARRGQGRWARIRAWRGA